MLKNLYQKKEIIYYEQAINALHKSCFYKDICILVLSAFFIALNIFYTKSDNLNVVSNFIFGICIILTLYIFENNKDLINLKIENICAHHESKISLNLDKVNFILFSLALLLFLSSEIAHA